jgi:hypothetical protein
MWSGIAGAGLIYLVGRPAERRNVGLGLALLIAPMIGHGIWDAAPTLGGAAGGFAIYFVLGIIAIVLLVWTYRHTVSTEQQWMHDILEPEVARGVITEDELTATAGSHKVRRHYIKSHKGHHAERAAKHVVEAIHELADEIAVSNGVDTPDVDHARAEIARLRA